jgi:hypothetical protein
MSVTLEGDVIVTLPRMRTGLLGVDLALGDLVQGKLGGPLRCNYEIYGLPERGKNTLAFYLAGRVRPTGRIIYIWLETFDPNYVISAVSQAGFDGFVKMIDHYPKGADPYKDPPKSHGQMLLEGTNLITEPETTALVMDSISMIQGMAEQTEEEAFGESYWGQRAKMVNQWVRTLEGRLIDRPGDPAAAFLINHVQVEQNNPNPRYPMYTTPGGQGKSDAAAVRVHLKTPGAKDPWKKAAFTLDADGFSTTRGVVEKLRFGGKGREFIFAMVPGLGVSPELTAMTDCLVLGLAERTSAGVKVNGKVVARLDKLVQLAIDRDRAAFAPFSKALLKWENDEYGSSPYDQTDPQP